MAKNEVGDSNVSRMETRHYTFWLHGWKPLTDFNDYKIFDQAIACLSLTIFDITAKHVFASDVGFQVENVISSFFK